MRKHVLVLTTTAAILTCGAIAASAQAPGVQNPSSQQSPTTQATPGKPRPGMLDAGARPGSLLFSGQVSDGQYSGTAYIFNSHCGAIPFQVKGPILDNDERIMLTGQAPRVGRNCSCPCHKPNTIGSRQRIG
jgi:hypothetical protein